ncbi:chloride channel protein [Vagococcus carniphilus]|uniref:Chloride channel protein n=1 Tax=Vagococcus carniphilus TaxID=218144 RepID=A0AAW8UBP1_9ENTE|nr:chloride channel protein [Vagococcus carniphilus]MDT2831737.1 chloride channel protein [Vagococcus carniphilus]MDT2835104.1 chloride channel protein [Vagococcus carniphilus]MDT2855248.1 chloride channel protein [Vagococcus carniphilus]
MEKKKWFGLILFSLVIGGVIGVLEVIFGKTLLLVTEWRLTYFSYLIFFLPFVGLLIEFLYTKFGGKSRQGMGLIFAVGHGEEKEIPLRLIPIVMISTWLTHLFGGSAGREGVAVQIGGTLSHKLGTGKLRKYLPEENLSQITLITGMAAGFAGLFQTPMGAILFALEVLVVGKLQMTALLSATIASFTASFISSFLELEKFSFFVESQLEMNLPLIGKLIVIGIAFGLVGRLFSFGLAKSKAWISELIPNPYMRIFLGGILVAILIVVLHHGRYAGLGSNLINASFEGKPIYTYDFLLKLLLTIMTLAIGFQGGEVTPLFAIGASLGVILAPILGLPIEVASAIGYIAVFGSATNTFLAPVIIGGEVFGYHLLPVFFIAMSVAYSCNFNQSIYGKQKILK